MVHYIKVEDLQLPGDGSKDYRHDDLIAELNARVMLVSDLTRERYNRFDEDLQRQPIIKHL